MRKFIFIIIAFSVFMHCSAQKAAEEYKKTMEIYRKTNQFSFDVDVYAYENKTDKKAQLVGKGTAKKKDGIFYSRFMEKEIVYSPEITLMINHDKKLIDCYEYNFNEKQKNAAFDFTKFADSSSVKSDTSLVYYGLEDGKKHFSISNPGQIITRTDIFVNPSNSTISRIVYGYGESTDDYDLGVSTVVIYYKNTQLENVTSDNLKMEKFVSKKGDEYVASAYYKGFKVILHKNKKST